MASTDHFWQVECSDFVHTDT